MQRSPTLDPGSNNQFTRYLLNLSRPLALKFKFNLRFNLNVLKHLFKKTDPGSNNQFTRYLLNLSRPLAPKFAPSKNEPRWLLLKSETIFSSAFSQLTLHCSVNHSYKVYIEMRAWNLLVPWNALKFNVNLDR